METPKRQCPSCAAPVSEDGEACRACGSPLTADNRMRKRLGWILIAGALAVGALPCLFIDALGPGVFLLFSPLLLVALIFCGYGIWLFLSRPSRGKE